MSSHLMPVVSAQLLCATPTAHWVEYVDWADAILQQPLEIADGKVLVPDRPGSGIFWDEAKLNLADDLNPCCPSHRRSQELGPAWIMIF
jgi:mandelate racemase